MCQSKKQIVRFTLLKDNETSEGFRKRKHTQVVTFHNGASFALGGARSEVGEVCPELPEYKGGGRSASSSGSDSSPSGSSIAFAYRRMTSSQGELRYSVDAGLLINVVAADCKREFSSSMKSSGKIVGTIVERLLNISERTKFIWVLVPFILVIISTFGNLSLDIQETGVVGCLRI
jgi:hypothetical protein